MYTFRLAQPFCMVVVYVYTPPAAIFHPGMLSPPRKFENFTRPLYYNGSSPPPPHALIDRRKTSLTGILPTIIITKTVRIPVSGYLRRSTRVVTPTRRSLYIVCDIYIYNVFFHSLTCFFIPFSRQINFEKQKTKKINGSGTDLSQTFLISIHQAKTKRILFSLLICSRNPFSFSPSNLAALFIN